MERKTMYHVTKKKNLPGIRKKGLVPQIGGNAKIAECREALPHVYLCEREDVPIWLIFTQSDAVLKAKNIETSENSGYHRNYDGYSEFLYFGTVKPESLEPAAYHGKEEMEASMAKLAKGTVYWLSRLTDECIDMEWLRRTGGMGETEWERAARELADGIEYDLAIMSRIDKNALADGEYAKTLTEHSLEECAISFADHYANEGIRCYEKLLQMPEPLKGAAEKLNRFITERFPEPVRNVKEIGGWCK